jgi:hypothetical protein
MTGAKMIGCINHPGMEAVGRCLQCSKPVCKQCGIVSVTGLYCSEVCREKYEQYMHRAQALESEKGYKRGFFFGLKRAVGVVITLAVILFVLGCVASLTYIPLLTDVTTRIRSLLGI